MIICYFGDSITLGYGDPSGLGWPGRISGKVAGLGVDVTHYNLGVRKDAGPVLAQRWKAEAEPRKLDGMDFKLVFSMGAADVLTCTATEDSLAAAKAILTEAKGMGDVLMVGPTPVSDADSNGKIAALSEQYESLCAELDIPFVPVIDGMLPSPVYGQALKAGDGIHPALPGYAVLAEHILQSEPAREFFGLE